MASFRTAVAFTPREWIDTANYGGSQQTTVDTANYDGSRQWWRGHTPIGSVPTHFPPFSTHSSLGVIIYMLAKAGPPLIPDILLLPTLDMKDTGGLTFYESESKE